MTTEHEDPLEQMAHALDLHKRHIERCEEALRKITEGSDLVRQQGLVEARRILEKSPAEQKASGFAALSPADQEEWRVMLAEMKDPDTQACGCGYPGQECLRVVLRNGPPYPPRPCEPKGTS